MPSRVLSLSRADSTLFVRGEQLSRQDMVSTTCLGGAVPVELRAQKGSPEAASLDFSEMDDWRVGHGGGRGES